MFEAEGEGKCEFQKGSEDVGYGVEQGRCALLTKVLFTGLKLASDECAPSRGDTAVFNTCLSYCFIELKCKCQQFLVI